MPIKPEDVTWVKEPQYGLLDAMYLPAIAEGVRTTVRHLFKPDTITQQYPEEKPELPLNYRGVHRLNRDDQGHVKCVACFLCATACPARCIEIIGDKAPSFSLPSDSGDKISLDAFKDKTLVLFFFPKADTPG